MTARRNDDRAIRAAWASNVPEFRRDLCPSMEQGRRGFGEESQARGCRDHQAARGKCGPACNREPAAQLGCRRQNCSSWTVTKRRDYFGARNAGRLDRQASPKPVFRSHRDRRNGAMTTSRSHSLARQASDAAI